ncbi:hypothetical protein IW148_000374 [Coemansia sp. RSA 1199]|nr:hypothetical protein IW148_000374 [Coemansia sp. RSA 1199]
MRNRGRRSSNVLCLNTKDTTDTTTVARSFGTDDERVVRRAIRQISIGDFAHLPPLRDLKVLFNNPLHQQLLQHTYRTLYLDHLAIDEVTARVLSVILLSRQCKCRNLQLHRCSFTDSGRKVFFSALSIMAEYPADSHSGVSPISAKSSPNVALKMGLGARHQMTLQSRRSSDSHALALCAGMDNMAPMGLYALELCQLGLTDKKCAWLGSVLETQPYLQLLSLRDNHIGHMGIRRLIAPLARGCRELSVLDLSGNMLQSQGVRILTQFLVTSGQGLETLDISSNGVTLTGAQDLANVLVPEFNLSLKHLNLNMNQLEGGGCEAMGRMLLQNQTLEVLTLSQNNMFDNGCQALFIGLENNTTLLSLDISGNFISHIGARSIQTYLQSSRSQTGTDSQQTGLQSLNISANSLGDEGIGVLCGGLRTNRHLIDLIANNVDVTNNGMRHICQVLKAGAVNTPSLLTLSLRHNYRLTRNSYAELAEASKANRNILRIAADLQFEGWDEVWTKVEMILIRNTVYAMERYRVPLLMVARGRILLRKITHNTGSSSTGIYSLPVELRRMILIALDKHNVLNRIQHICALNIACSPAKHFSTKQELLAAVLGDDYAFVHEMVKTVHS